MLVVLTVEGIVHEIRAGQDLGMKNVDLVIAVQTLLGLLRMGVVVVGRHLRDVEVVVAELLDCPHSLTRAIVNGWQGIPGPPM